VSMAWGRTYQLSFWMYHGLYVLAFVTLFAGWGLEAARAGSLKVIAEGLSMRDALAQLNRGRPSALVALADEIEVKDEATLGHVSRVASYALGIGRELGLPAWELRSLVLAAQMHDVGKIGTPDAILRKPGSLTDEEFTVIKQHTVRGHEIAGQVEALRSICEVVRHHHERIDGAGYPDGLRGEEIPLHSRIISVADTYDALTSDRPYRSAKPSDEALTEVRRVSGSQLDSRVVESFAASLSRPKTAHDHEADELAA
jgi:HD-GYP domain-containing protein (c-di-GMP phosphodiesterase class II)